MSAESNVFPYIQETRSWREERYYKVPLCASDCDVWFNSCAEDYTCTNNWARNFEWKTSENGTGKTNVCPKDSICDTFKSVFKDAKTFCETVGHLKVYFVCVVAASIHLHSILHLCKIVLHMEVTTFCNHGKGKIFGVLRAFIVLS